MSFFFPTSSFSFFPQKKSCGHLAFWSALTIPTARPNQNILAVWTKTAKTLFFCFWLDSYSALSVNQFVCISLTFCLNWLVCLGVWGVMSCVMEPKYGVCGVQRLLAAHNLYSEGCWSTDVVEALNITNQNWFRCSRIWPNERHSDLSLSSRQLKSCMEASGLCQILKIIEARPFDSYLWPITNNRFRAGRINE